MNFQEVLSHSLSNTELIAEFDRLTGCNLQRKGSVIDHMVDESTGKTNDDLKKFVAFVWWYIYVPLLSIEL